MTRQEIEAEEKRIIDLILSRKLVIHSMQYNILMTNVYNERLKLKQNANINSRPSTRVTKTMDHYREINKKKE